MSAVNAFCDNCLLVFAVPGFDLGEGGSNVVIRNNAIACPRCGNLARMTDLVIDEQGRELIESLESLLSRSGVSREDLQKLGEILQHARQEGSTPAEVGKRIEAEVPALSSFAKKIHLPELTQWVTILALLWAVVQTYLTLPSPQPPQNINIEVKPVININNEGVEPTPKKACSNQRKQNKPPRGKKRR